MVYAVIMNQKQGKEIVFSAFQEKFQTELNTWQAKEQANGSNGLNQFVVLDSMLLGDYLAFIDQEMDDIDAFLAFDAHQLIGFLCCSYPEPNHAHVEIMGVNPDCRGKGYGTRILDQFKIQLQTTAQKEQRLTLAVKKTNTAGLSSFTKIAKVAPEQNKDNYLNLEL